MSIFTKEYIIYDVVINDVDYSRLDITLGDDGIYRPVIDDYQLYDEDGKAVKTKVSDDILYIFVSCDMEEDFADAYNLFREDCRSTATTTRNVHR